MPMFAADCVGGPHDGMRMNLTLCPREGDEIMPVGETTVEKLAVYVFKDGRWRFSHYEQREITES